MTAATKMDSKRGMMGKHDGAPTYFAIHCMEARAGGSNNYSTAAYHLSIHVWGEPPSDISSWIHWQDECMALDDLCRDGDDDAIWAWFRRCYPNCMQLVPTRRKRQFLSGVYQAHEEERIV